MKGNGKIYVTDVTKVWEIEPSGKKSVYLQASDFPLRPKFLNDLESDGFGNLFISDTGALDGSEQGAIFVVEPNKKVRVLIDGSKQAPRIQTVFWLTVNRFYSTSISSMARYDAFACMMARPKKSARA